MTEKQPSASTDENGNREDVMSERFTLPVLPLRDTVVYPGVGQVPGWCPVVQELLTIPPRVASGGGGGLWGAPFTLAE